MQDYGKMDFSVSFNPTSGFPLDARCEFDSYEQALAAAQTAGEVGNKQSKYYHGMVLTVHGEKVQKYVIQTDGTLELLGSGTASGSSVPTFNLAEIGLSTVAANGGPVFLEADATEICTALENGASTFVIPFSMGDEVLSLRVTMNGIGISGTTYMGVAHLYTSEPLVIILGANADGIMVSSVSMQTVLGIPTVTGEDNGKLIQVVGGEMQAVSVADSPIAAYIDDYIATALGGDY